MIKRIGNVFAAALLAWSIGMATDARSQPPQQPTASFCSGADVGPATSGGDSSATPPPPSSAPAGGGASAAAHVGVLRAQLQAVAAQFLEASARLLGQPTAQGKIDAGGTSAYVAQLRSELGKIVIKGAEAKLGAHVELVLLAAQIDSLAERIHAYELAYGRGPGETTTPFNVLRVEDLLRARAAIASAEHAVAFEIARAPAGVAALDLELRLRELVDLRTQLDGELTLRTSRPQPQLLMIATKDTRAQALVRHPTIAAVDADDVQRQHYAQKVALHLELRASGRSSDASLAMMRDDFVREVRKSGHYDPGKALIASFRGRYPSDPPRSDGPRPPEPPPPSKPSPAGGPRGPPGEGLHELKAALGEEFAAVRDRGLEKMSAARGALAAEKSVLRAALSNAYFDGVEFAALSDSELKGLRADYERWLGHLATESSALDARPQLKLEIAEAELRLSKIKAVAEIRAGSAWRGVLGAAAPARAPPTSPEQLAALVSSSRNPVVAAARSVAPVIGFQVKAETLASRAGSEGVPQTPALPRLIEQARAAQLSAQGKVLQSAISSLLDVQLRLLGAPSAADVDGRRLVSGARATIAGAVHAYNAELRHFRTIAPRASEVLIDMKLPTGWTGATNLASSGQALSLLREGLVATEAARRYANGRLMAPVTIAQETNAGLESAQRISLGRLGVTPASESTDFDKLFPRDQVWTRDRIALARTISRLPGGVVVAPGLPHAQAQQLANIFREPRTGRIFIIYAGRVLRTELQTSAAEFRDALAFAFDRRVIAIDIRPLKANDIDWLIQNALDVRAAALTAQEVNLLLRELAELSSINMHPELEHGPWSTPFIEADQLVFNVLPHRTTPAIGEFSFRGLELRELREAFRRDQQAQFNVAFAMTPELAPRKSVLTFSSATLRCAGNHVAIDVKLDYDVYQTDHRMPETSAWLSARDAAIRARTPAIRDAARFASLQALFMASLATGGQTISTHLMDTPPEAFFSPKFLCSSTRPGTEDCILKVLSQSVRAASTSR